MSERLKHRPSSRSWDEAELNVSTLWEALQETEARLQDREREQATWKTAARNLAADAQSEMRLAEDAFRLKEIEHGHRLAAETRLVRVRSALQDLVNQCRRGGPVGLDRANAALARKEAERHPDHVAWIQMSARLAEEERRADGFARQFRAAETRLAQVREAIKRVLWFDWSENDEDAVAAIRGLGNALAEPAVGAPQGGGAQSTQPEAISARSADIITSREPASNAAPSSSASGGGAMEVCRRCGCPNPLYRDWCRCGCRIHMEPQLTEEWPHCTECGEPHSERPCPYPSAPSASGGGARCPSCQREYTALRFSLGAGWLCNHCEPKPAPVDDDRLRAIARLNRADIIAALRRFLGGGSGDFEDAADAVLATLQARPTPGGA